MERERNAKSQFFQNRAVWWLGLATWLSREFKPRANRMARLDFLSCSAPVGVTVHLLYMLYSCASSSGLQAASHPWDLTASPCFTAQSWAFLHTLSHTTLTWIPPKYRVSKCWITSKLARNKANTMVDKFQPYNLPLWLFRDKTLKQTLDLTCELGTVEQNSLTPNSRICVALES